MGNVADIILSRGANDETIAQAESWAKKGLDVATTTRSKMRTKHQVCEVAYAVLLYNVAMTREVSLNFRSRLPTIPNPRHSYLVMSLTRGNFSNKA